MPVSLMGQDGSIAGAKIFSTNCSGCHGSDGRGGERAPNIATARNVSSLTANDLANIMRNGIAGSGMPSFNFLGDKGIAEVVAYLRILQGKTSDAKATGDSDAGRALFFGQTGCSNCHMVHGEGGFIASDLTDYASGIAPDVIRRAIVESGKVVPTGSQVVDFVTASGKHINGVLRSEDNFNITVQMRDGRFHHYTKSSLKRLDYTGQSLMPTDYGTRLTATQLDNIISYLVRSANSLEPASRRRKKRGDD